MIGARSAAMARVQVRHAASDGPYLAIDLGAPSSRPASSTATARSLVRDRIGTPTREVWTALEQLVLRVLAARPDDVAAPSAVGVSCAGPIDAAGRCRVAGCTCRAWSGLPAAPTRRGPHRAPRRARHAAGACRRGERRCGDTVTDLELLRCSCSIATIESACILDGGRLLRALTATPVTIGHIVVEPERSAVRVRSRRVSRGVRLGVRARGRDEPPAAPRHPSIIERTGIMVGRAIASVGAVVRRVDVRAVRRGRRHLRRPLCSTRCGARSLHGCGCPTSAGLQVVEPSGFVQPLVGAAALAGSPVVRAEV